MKKLLIPLILVLSISALIAFNVSYSPYNTAFITDDCPKEGSKKDNSPLSAREKASNKKKNRSSAVPNKHPKILKFEQILQGKTRTPDRKSWIEGTYVEINDAYLINRTEQNGESCNCYEADDDRSKGDVHINIGKKASLKEKDNDYYMVAEITPSYKALHPNYASEVKALIGKKVTIRGYLFYDGHHEHNSFNYCSTCEGTGVWRKTCWEIHPITFIGLTNN